MKITLRSSLFETNSSSAHTFIFISKETFEAWKRGEKILTDCSAALESVSRDCDFEDVKTPKIGWKQFDGSYESILEFHNESGGDTVLRDEAFKKYADPKEWNTVYDCDNCDRDYDCEECDHDIVFQNSFMDIKDNGKRVRIHIWGR